jgi:molybdopterin-guanine dinucleotide biosynthesis protein A
MESQSPPASAIVLAGGQSRRMGRVKAALSFGSATILGRIIKELSGHFDDLIVVAAPREAEPCDIRRLLPPSIRVRLIRDPNQFEGPADALARGLRTARHGIAFVCSCDLPLIRADIAVALCGMLRGYDAVVPEIGGRLQPLYAAYRREATAMIEKGIAAGDRRLTALLETLRLLRINEAELRRRDPDLTSFLNVNTPEEYDRAIALAGIAKSS